MHKPLYRLLVLLLATLLLNTLVPIAVSAEATDDIKIVSANSTFADFASNVVGDAGIVEYIMPAGVCPSHFDSRPSDVGMVAEADVIIQIGWEGWLNDLIGSSGNEDVHVIKLMGMGDWNLPADAKVYVDAIAVGLGKAYPEMASNFQANADAFNIAIDLKASELTNRVTTEGVSGRKVVVMEWQMAFVEWLGFQVETSYDMPEDMGLQDQLDVSSAASRDGVVMVVDNLQSGTEFGGHVAAETGKIHVILTNFPSAYPNTYTYLDMLDFNTEQLIDGAKSYEYKQGDIADLESQVADLELQSTVYLTMCIVFLAAAAFMGTLFWRARSRGD
jgi:ABC-type Zn uptake system ZnuABC Zn-binding protein ZnuA